MSAFDGIDPVQTKAIRKALEKEIRADLTEELSADIRRKVERDVREEARQDVLREIAERAPTDEERETFSAYVNEVRLDAYAQATMASEIAEDAEAKLTRSRRVSEPILVGALVAVPAVVQGTAWQLGGYTSSTFITVTLTFALFILMLWIASFRRHGRLERASRKHRKVASDFLIIAERAKAYAMVHAERLASSGELGELLESLRRDKEKQDRVFHASAAELERARALAGVRIAEDGRARVAVDLDAEGAEEEEAPPVKKRARAR